MYAQAARRNLEHRGTTVDIPVSEERFGDGLEAGEGRLLSRYPDNDLPSLVECQVILRPGRSTPGRSTPGRSVAHPVEEYGRTLFTPPAQPSKPPSHGWWGVGWLVGLLLAELRIKPGPLHKKISSQYVAVRAIVRASKVVNCGGEGHRLEQ